MALPSIVMSLAMKIIHVIVNISGLSFSFVSSKVLRIAWFLVRKWYFLIVILIIILLYYYDYWTFHSIWNIIKST